MPVTDAEHVLSPAAKQLKPIATTMHTIQKVAPDRKWAMFRAFWDLRDSLHLCPPSAEQIDLCQIDDFVAPATQNCFEGEERKSFHLRETYRRRHGEFLPMDVDLH
jgi:hypothetical protein